MKKYILRTNDLSKRYQKKNVVHQVNMEIEKGEIYGFIGPNGAGKSTFLRLIAGLTYPEEGSIELFGQHEFSRLHKARRQIGTLIEEPALFPNMTAEQNLEVVRLQRGIPGKECIDQVLRKVGLKNTGKKKVQNFSLGMKQRLGIAITLLSDPEFLMLDEPINGLDPMGVVEIRELLKEINQNYGVTILLSSHILSEVYQIATKFGIIHQGKLLQQFTAKELEEKSKAHFLIEVDEPTKAVIVFEEQLQTTHYDVMPDGKIKLYSYLNEGHVVSQTLANHGLKIEQFTPKRDTLEEYFTSLIQAEEGSYV